MNIRSQNELQRVVAEREDLAQEKVTDIKQRMGADNYSYGYYVGKVAAFGEVSELIESAQAVAPGGITAEWVAGYLPAPISGWQGVKDGYEDGYNDAAKNCADEVRHAFAEWNELHRAAAPASEAVETVRIGDFGIHGLAARIGVRYAADESCSLGAPFYAFSEDELDKFADVIRSAANTTHWQANMTADDTTGKCCAFMGTFACSCGRYVASEAVGLEELERLLCWAYDNLSDMPISEEWADKWCKEFRETAFAKDLLGKPAASSAVGECPFYSGGDCTCGNDQHPWISSVHQKDEQEQAGELERTAAEHEYTMTAFDYARNPVGSRDWTLYWKGWQVALLRRAARVEVDDAMVERALVVRAMREDQAQWPDAYSEDEQRMERENMRSELCAALKVDGPSAYCRACQSVGMSNCAHFDECSGATCITCHRPLNLEPGK